MSRTFRFAPSVLIVWNRLACVALVGLLYGCTAQVEDPVEVGGEEPVGSEQDALTLHWGSFSHTTYVMLPHAGDAYNASDPWQLYFRVHNPHIPFQPVTATIDNSQNPVPVTFSHYEAHLDCGGFGPTFSKDNFTVAAGARYKVNLNCGILSAQTVDVAAWFYWAT